MIEKDSSINPIYWKPYYGKAKSKKKKRTRFEYGGDDNSLAESVWRSTKIAFHLRSEDVIDDRTKEKYAVWYALTPEGYGDQWVYAKDDDCLDS